MHTPQINSARSLLILEIDANLRLINDYWTRLHPQYDSNPGSEGYKKEHARRFINIPFPNFGRKVLESQLSIINIALLPQELIQVFQFYDRLDKIKSAREELLIAEQIQQIGPNLSEPKPYIPISYKKFDDIAINYWDEIDNLFTQIIENGNPLNSKSTI